MTFFFYKVSLNCFKVLEETIAMIWIQTYGIFFRISRNNKKIALSLVQYIFKYVTRQKSINHTPFFIFRINLLMEIQ